MKTFKITVLRLTHGDGYGSNDSFIIKAEHLKIYEESYMFYNMVGSSQENVAFFPVRYTIIESIS